MFVAGYHMIAENYTSSWYKHMLLNLGEYFGSAAAPKTLVPKFAEICSPQKFSSKCISQNARPVSQN